VAVQLAPAATVVLAGQANVGGVWSTTVTVKEQVLELPAASVACMVTVFAPTVTLVPAAGVWVSVGLAVQLSDEVVEAV
jgi:hypothetical protein